MRIYQLEGFFYVGKHLGYTAAAKAMPYPIGQPAVFQQVKTLEGDLGLKLIAKPKKGKLQLTPEGRRLHEFISPFFDELPRVEAALTKGSEGVIILGAPHLILAEWLPEKLSAFRKRHPTVAFQLVEDNEPSRLLDLVMTGRIDLALNYFPDLPTHLQHRVVGAFEGTAAVPLKHPLARRSSVTLKDLAPYPLITYPAGHLVRHIIEGAFHKAQVPMNVVMEASNRELMLRYVSEHLGVAVVHSMNGRASSQISGIRLLPLPKVFAPHPIHLVMRSGLAQTPLLEAALELLSGKTKGRD